MTAPDPGPSRPPDRTGVCGESRGAPPAPGWVGGLGFRSPNRPDKGRNPTYRVGSRRGVWCERPSCYHRRQLAGAIWRISEEMLCADLPRVKTAPSEDPEDRRALSGNLRFGRRSSRVPLAPSLVAASAERSLVAGMRHLDTGRVRRALLVSPKTPATDRAREPRACVR